ncbi:hypothetical protein [Siminovitchia fortis]|uniref:hypothetical protein n=1 Tax=Siminovitchia fortis TaxID=254758 RepID=UPI0011A2D7C7|nr:hypothetical protein [Siminovitchia fortis]
MPVQKAAKLEGQLRAPHPVAPSTLAHPVRRKKVKTACFSERKFHKLAKPKFILLKGENLYYNNTCAFSNKHMAP